MIRAKDRMFEIPDWKTLGANTVAGYIGSWLLFFLLLKPFMAAFGKVQGGVLNYGFSWITWLGITYVLQIYNPGGEK